MSKIEIKATCKDCLFFKELIHPSEHFTCSQAGYLEYSSPCQNFCYNSKKLRLIESQEKDVFGFIRKIPTTELNGMAALLLQEGYNRSWGWSIGDIAYFNLGKEDYVSSYVQVVFKGLAGNLDMAIIEGNRQDHKVWNGEIQIKSLLKKDQWIQKHKELVSLGRIFTDSLSQILPGYKYPSKEELSAEGYTPKNISQFYKYFPEGDLTKFIQTCQDITE